MKFLFMLFLSLSFAASALDIDNIPSSTFPEIDIRSQHDKDAQREKLGVAPRFAIEREVSINPFRMNNWTIEQDYKVWRYRVKAKNAVSFNFAFTEFNMGEKAELNIFSSDFSDSIRSFTNYDNNMDNELWTPVVYAEDVIIEFKVPLNDSTSKLKLTQVNQGYRKFTQTTEKAGSCNVDVACSEGDEWRDEISSVGVISTGGSTFCTGFMVNNTANDKKPLFMTANHCRVNRLNARSLVVYWNYETSKCGGRRDGRKDQFNTGSKFLASHSDSDFAIVELNKSPSEDWNVSFAGFDATGEDATMAVAIHHPSTDEKSISFEFDPTTVTSYLGSDVPGKGTHVRVKDWDIGTTEPGSSGSPLFNQDHRVIGQLHGGYASCSSNTSDWYGRIYTSWEGGGSSSTRLKDHLDPIESGELITDTIR